MTHGPAQFEKKWPRKQHADVKKPVHVSVRKLYKRRKTMEILRSRDLPGSENDSLPAEHGRPFQLGAAS